MQDFLVRWGEAAYTTASFFWMALWAFILGYAVSSIIQLFVTPAGMQKTMGGSNAKGVLLGAFFGFISSSCSFSALATTKTLFQKGASFVAAMAFLLASTNLVVELGIVISVFLGWQFVVGEYAGGILLIIIVWTLVALIRPKNLITQARNNLQEGHKSDGEDNSSLLDKLKSWKMWARVGQQYAMEWKMVWKDVTVGFTVAGVIAVFVPDSFFQTLFIETGEGQTSFSLGILLEHVLVAPLAAFLTFIGSMGNIPLAALLYTKGVSFAGVMAFIFSDLVVFPVLRINAKYYGWKMSLFILFLLYVALVITSLGLHYGMEGFNVLPSGSEVSILEQNHFALDYTFFLNLGFLLVSAVLIYLGFFKGKSIHHHKEMAPKGANLERFLKYLAYFCYAWLALGLTWYFVL